MTVARELGEFLAETKAAELPAQALDHAAMLIASTIASAALGSNIASARIIRELAREKGGRPDAAIWFDGGARIPADEAAQANAVMSDAAASDDSDLRMIVHCGTPLSTTSLALAERTGASGEEVLAAIVLGYEAAGRVIDRVTPGLRERGFHGCIAAIFASAAAAGRLMQLDASRMTQALALSATSIGGLAAAANTSTAREYHGGLATLLGIRAAEAAGRGFIAEEGIFEHPQGYFAIYGGGTGVGAMDWFGDSWDIVSDMAVKLVPGGHPYHALAEAAANAARAGNFAPDEIDSITVSRPGLTALTGPLHPSDLIGMAHSPAYFLAAAAADRDFSWVHATPAKIADAVIHRLIDKVRVGPPPAADIERYRQGATVTIRATDGRSAASTVFVPHGAGMLGLAWADIDAKYHTLLPHAGLSGERIAASLALIHEFRAVPHAAALAGLLRRDE